MDKSKKNEETKFRIKKRWSFAGLCLVWLIIVALGFILKDDRVIEKSEKQTGFFLKETNFNNLTGFNEDNLLQALPPMQKSCRLIAKRPISYYAEKSEWKKVCKNLLNSSFTSNISFKNFIKNNFKPYLVTFNGDSKGIFTGYYVPLLNGSRQKTKKFNVPIYAEPRDIVFVDVEDFYPNCKGCKIIGKIENKKLSPYPERKLIDKKEIDAEVLVWIDSEIDNFILHIQGSGKVRFPDGVTKTIGFAGFNGHKFVGIGSLMIREKLIANGDYSMPSIKKWLKENPKKAKELMWKNPRYIFFRNLATEPVGAQGIPLTPRRSLAIDSQFIDYGIPIWLDTFDAEKQPLQRLMIAQDTGGAIKGAVRGDFFWGEGEEAFYQAGRMKRQGQYYVLLPPKNHFTEGKLPIVEDL